MQLVVVRRELARLGASLTLSGHDPSKGYSRAEGTKMLADLKSDLISGDVITIPAPWPQIHLAAERLSELYTDASGHRSMDILHVAKAIELGMKEFLGFYARHLDLPAS